MDEFVPCDPPGNGGNGYVNEVYAGLFEKSLEKLEDDFNFDEFLEIVERNSEGRDIRVIGSFLYRGIVGELYEPLPKESLLDIDFLVERPTSRVVDRLRGWEIEITSHGDLAFIKTGSCKVNIIPLFNLYGIESRRLPQTIRKFYHATPLNVQSITYNCNNGKISGARGIEAIEKKIIKANNLEGLMLEAKRLSELALLAGSHVTADDLIKAKAKELGFGYELPKKP